MIEFIRHSWLQVYVRYRTAMNYFPYFLLNIHPNSKYQKLFFVFIIHIISILLDGLL
jgi:hypothetical protein